MLAYMFVLLAIGVRFLPFAGPLSFLPHVWHFTPLAASLLYFGARGSKRQMWVPLAMLAVTDVVLTRMMYGFPFSWDILVTWMWYAAILWLGTGLREKSAPVRVIAAALASSVSFFLISNFVAWAGLPGMYPRNFSGVMMSYAAALPFFRGTISSDLIFSLGFFFAIPAAIELMQRAFANDSVAAA